MRENPHSEVVRLMQQIEMESQAMQSGLAGLATAAAHTIIAHRYDAIGQAHDQLVHLVGEQQAAELMLVAYSRGLEGGRA